MIGNRLIFGAGSGPYEPVGTKMEFKHDQNSSDLGSSTVHGWISINDLKAGKLSGVFKSGGSMPLYVFK